MEWLLLAVAIAASWWFGSRSKAAKPAAEQVEEEAPSFEDYPDELERNPLGNLDGEEIEIRRASETFERYNSERDARFRERKNAIEADEKKLERARAFIESSHLATSVPAVWEEIRHWPSWSRLEEGRWSPPVTGLEITGSEGVGAKPEWTQFRIDGGSLFKLEFEKSGTFADEELEFATMRVFANGDRVLEIGTSRNWANEWEQWRFSTVDCLMVGPWISELIEFHCRLRAQKDEQSAQWEHEYISGRAANVNLGDVRD